MLSDIAKAAPASFLIAIVLWSAMVRFGYLEQDRALIGLPLSLLIAFVLTHIWRAIRSQI